MRCRAPASSSGGKKDLPAAEQACLLEAEPDDLLKSFAHPAQRGLPGTVDFELLDEAFGKFTDRAIAQLALAQGLLGPLARVDVHGGAGDASRATGGVIGHDAAAVQYPAPAAVGAANAVLELDRLRASFQVVEHVRLDSRAIIGVHALQPGLRLGIPRLGGPAGDREPLVAARGELGEHVPVPVTDIAAPEHRVETYLAVLEPLLEALALADVAACNHDSGERGICAPIDQVAGEGRPVPVGAAQAHFECPGQRHDRMRNQAFESLAQRRHVIWMHEVEQGQSRELGCRAANEAFDFGVLVKDGAVRSEHQDDVAVMRGDGSRELLQCRRGLAGLIRHSQRSTVSP